VTRGGSATYLEDEVLQGIRVRFTAAELLDLVGSLLEELLQSVVSSSKDLDTRVVQSGGLSTARQSWARGAFHSHLPSDLGLLALLLILRIDSEGLLSDNLGLQVRIVQQGKDGKYGGWDKRD
jgi:hypothetical protein